MPDGHGPRYRAAYVDGWYAVLRPPGVSERDLARLRDVVAGRT